MTTASVAHDVPPPADGCSYTTGERWTLAARGWIFSEITQLGHKDKRFKIEGRYHRPYWVTFNGRADACMEAPSEDEARDGAAEITGCEVLSVRPLPYPASPRLRPFEHPHYGVAPDLCINGAKCAGSTSCPRNRSCSE